MTVQPHSKPVANRTETVLDSSQLPKVYVATPIGKRLAQRGVTLSNLAQISEVSLADVSHYVHGRPEKIGRKRRQRIFEALCTLEILKKRVRKPPICKRCGVSFPTKGSVPENDLPS